jgi:hypothetical protein
MTLAARSPEIRPVRDDGRLRVGDGVAALAAEYSARMNQSRFATDLRAGKVDRHRYVTYLCTMYPVVVGFNRALIRGIAKVDHVRHSSFVRVLAEQLQEEQAHNQLWRVKMELFGIDHEALYGDLTDYLAQYTALEQDELTRRVLGDVKDGRPAGASSHFADSVFPDPILALYHHLWMTASEEGIGHWEHFASQAGLEMVIYDVVSTSFLPGILGRPELDLGEGSTHWWREHGRHPDLPTTGRTDEEKHLELSRVALNRSETANATASQVIDRAEDTMRLFAATMECQEAAAARFPVASYQR